MIYIGIHVMPWEIGEYRNLVRMMRLGLMGLNASDRGLFSLVATLNLNGEIIDWDHSRLPMELYHEQFLLSNRTLDGCIPVVERVGGVASTTEALRKNVREILTDDDQYLWLDPDICFSDSYFQDLLDALALVKDRTRFYIVSPTSVKLWDETWDVLVHESDMHYPYSYDRMKTADFTEFYRSEERSLDPLNCVKLAGGYGNLYSADLLRWFDIPDSYTIYGGIDTYIEFGAEFLRKKGLLLQYRINNCVTVQDFRFSDKELYKTYTGPKIDKEKQRELNQANGGVFHTAVLDLIRRIASDLERFPI